MLWTCFHFNACWLILHFIVLLSKRATLSVLLVVLLIYIYQKKNPVFPKMQFPHKIHTLIILKWFFTRMNSSLLNFTWLLLTSFYLRILSNISFIPNLFYNSNLKKKNSNFFFKTCILITPDLKKLFTTTSIEYLFFLL